MGKINGKTDRPIPAPNFPLQLFSTTASLTPPPKANGLTRRDGQLSDEALAGKELFDGRAGCAGCHTGPLSTNNQTFEDGITHGRVSTPTLVGAYRHRAWLKDGSAHSLEEATMAAAEWSGVTNLTDDDVSSITRYLRELTDRDFFLLGHEPDATRTFIGADEAKIAMWQGQVNVVRQALAVEGARGSHRCGGDDERGDKDDRTACSEQVVAEAALGAVGSWVHTESP